MNYKVYVRGHGGEEQQMHAPAQDLPISLITVGQMGCTMSDEVADQIIYNHRDTNWIQQNINTNYLIYWTQDQRNDWYDNGNLNYTSPVMSITQYDAINHNLALDGDASIGECGVCYYSPQDGMLHWIIQLQDGETIMLAQILNTLRGMLQNPDDTVELYWTACMSAQYWQGNRKKVSFNPTM